MNFADFIILAKKYSVFDWMMVVIFLAMGLSIEYSSFPPSFVSKVTSDISNPVKTQTVPYNYLCIFTFGIGALITICVWLLKCRDHTISKVLSAYYFSLCFTLFFNSILKHFIGRARPDTQTICGGDGSFEQCSAVLSGRALYDQFHSFPSGHSAESMSVGMFLTLLLSEMCPSSSMFAAAMKLAPTLWSILVGATRITDRCHHIDDVLAGLLVGGLIGFFTFKTFKIGIVIEQKPTTAAPTDTSASQFSAYI